MKYDGDENGSDSQCVYKVSTTKLPPRIGHRTEPIWCTEYDRTSPSLKILAMVIPYEVIDRHERFSSQGDTYLNGPTN